jgi:VanZ family protein
LIARSRSTKTNDATKLLFAYLLLILYLCLYPWTWVTTADEGNFLKWEPIATRADYLDIALNILFYLPLGTLAVLVQPGPKQRAGRSYGIVAACFILSLAIEITQSRIPGRDSSFRDVAANLTGGAVGVLAGQAFRRYLSVPMLLELRWLYRPVGLFLASTWVAGQLFPFLPILRLQQLRESVSRIRELPRISRLDTYQTFVTCLLLSYVLSVSVSKRAWIRSLGIALLVTVARFFFRGLSFSPIDIVVAASSFLASFLFFSGSAKDARRLVPLVLVLVIGMEFTPLSLAVRPSSFHFVPFATLLEGNRDAVLRILFLKLFVYTTCVLILRDAGLSLLSAAVLVVTTLFAGEVAQQYLPGRTPELTDPLLAAVGAILIVGRLPLRDDRT